MFVFEWSRFLSVCMQCSVDVIETLVEPLRFWSRYAIIPLAGLSRRSLAVGAHGHVMQQTIKIFIYQPIFPIFPAKKSVISRL